MPETAFSKEKSRSHFAGEIEKNEDIINKVIKIIGISSIINSREKEEIETISKEEVTYIEIYGKIK